jgi:glycosyltransferase involved in cell wall biosynthesis
MVNSPQIRGVTGQAVNHPAVSVIMPLYNKEHEIGRAIQSILLQTFTNFEVIVVNDGSTDRGSEIVRSLSDPRIRIIDQTNAGVSTARNKGIAEAQADLIAFLDADDEWEPDFLETIIRLRDQFPSCDIFATNYSFRRANSCGRRAIIRGLPHDFKEGILTDYFKLASQSDPPLCSSAVAVRKKDIEAIGGFPMGVFAGEDLLTWARLAVKYDIAYHIEPKAYFYESGTAIRPRRNPQVPDIVGEELKKLLSSSEALHKEGLKEYISFWYKMRASIFLRLDYHKYAREEIRKAIGLSGLNPKLIIFLVLAFLPNKMSRTVFRLWHKRSY